MKPSMFCHYAHCASNKAGFHKAAARSHLDRLLRTDWMCRAEWAAPVKCSEPENASARISVIRCFIYFIFFWRSLRNLHFSWRQTCRIGQVSQLLQLLNARGRSRKPSEERKNQRGSTSLSEKKTLNIAARPRSWNPRGRSVARPAGLGCRRRLAKAGRVKKKKRQKEKCKTDKNKSKRKERAHVSLAQKWSRFWLLCAWEAEPRSSSHKIGSHSGRYDEYH